MSTKLGERYELGRVVGAGGTARVYQGLDSVLGRTVAVKMLDATQAASNDPGGRERFLAEARSSASFTHPSVVAIYDAGEADGELFIVMEYVDGTTLARRLATDGPLAEPEAVRIATEVLAALGAAHAAGIVHRDVKPANILLSASGAVKLADFGIAKRFDDIADSLTSSGMVVGTPRYLAPEQAAGQPCTPAVDVYAVGVVLHEMLSGSPPTNGSALPDHVSPHVAAAIHRALRADPSRRFATASEMAAALTDPRSDHGDATVVVPAPIAPTTVMAAPPTDPQPTAVIAAPQPAAHAPAARTPGWWIAAVVALVGLVALAGLALALRDPVGPGAIVPDAAPTEDTTSGDAATGGASAPEEPPATALTEPVAVPPGAVAPAELVPGFPATDDILVFINQLRDGTDAAGTQSEKLGDRLQDVFSEEPDDRRDEIEKLIRDVQKWVEKGDLHPAVADAAIDFVLPLG